MVKLFDQAAIWAAHHEYPRIYEVEVECVVEDDPDAPRTAFHCEKARIVNVHKISAGNAFGREEKAASVIGQLATILTRNPLG